MKSKLFVNSNKYCSLLLLANKGILSTEVIPQNCMYSSAPPFPPPFNIIFSSSKENLVASRFTVTLPFNFEEAVVVLGLNFSTH